MTAGRLRPFTLPLRREGDAAIVDKNGKTVLVIDPDRDLEDDEATRIANHVFNCLSAAPAPEGGAVEATGARAVIRNGQIVISIDVDALPLILSGSIALNAVAGTFKVTDAPTFAKEVCHALNAEKEDGTTRVHMMFDSTFNHAIDQGAEGVEEISEDEFEAEASRLQAEAASALATREEAPAEAGALVSQIDALLAIPEANLSSRIPYLARELLERSAKHLRVQPPAREDEQPVAKPAPFDQGGIGNAMYQAFHAYHADYVLSTDGADYEPTPFERGLIEDFFAGLMAEEAFFGPVRALYDTHPAPATLQAEQKGGA